VDDHAKAVDIGNLQAHQLGTPYPCAIERHQYHAMKPSLGAVDEVGKSFWAQYAGKGSRPLRIRCIGHAPGFLDRLRVGEPQSREPLRHRGRGQLSLAEQIRLVGTAHRCAMQSCSRVCFLPDGEMLSSRNRCRFFLIQAAILWDTLDDLRCPWDSRVKAFS
jgi:hypothetical protein